MTEEDADNYCLICGEDFSESTEEEIEKCVQCKQRYHAHCINRWCDCLLYTSPSPRDRSLSRMPSSA